MRVVVTKYHEYKVICVVGMIARWVVRMDNIPNNSMRVVDASYVCMVVSTVISPMVILGSVML